MAQARLDRIVQDYPATAQDDADIKTMKSGLKRAVKNVSEDNRITARNQAYNSGGLAYTDLGGKIGSWKSKAAAKNDLRDHKNPLAGAK